MSAGTELLSTAEPHLIPGYVGYCPQYRYRCGETYGNLTHKVLLDPTVNHAETLILSNRISDDYEVLYNIFIVLVSITLINAVYKFKLIKIIYYL